MEVINPYYPIHGKDCLITNILQAAWPEDWITKAMVLSLGEAILFFGRHSKNEGLPYCRARNVEFGLGGPIQLGQEICIDRSFKKNCAGRLPHLTQGCGREENVGQRAKVTTGKNKAPQDSSCGLYCQAVGYKA